ncbi:MAG TPA: alpha-galactosidase [Candidatus Brocadiia bacterium]|nr:alpha-galactosidase [Candidatus Brocadiia bacterium]
MDINDIPKDVPQDEVMAGSDELADVLDWSGLAFAGKRLSGRPDPIRIELIRQDHSVLRIGKSCMETPIRIGSRNFAHGLGTHANSEIVIHVPLKARRFEAFCGIDNNYDTGGVRGSAVFSVEVAGKEVFRSSVQKGSDEARPVSVEIPAGTGRIVLKVDTTPDGPSHDQSDWADARFVLDDGTQQWVDDGHMDRLLSPDAPPFSFVYDGKPSASFLKSWRFESATKDAGDATEIISKWTDPATSLCAEAVVKVYKRYPAADWTLCFRNGGGQDTPIIENIQALDVGLRTGTAKTPAMLRWNKGDSCGPETFTIVDTAIEAGKSMRLAPAGGRSSSFGFPFFDVSYGGETLIAAIGWTGQWAANIERTGTGPARLTAGMELTHLKLHPGEAIRSPRILLTLNRCDNETAHNRFRRLMLFHNVPMEEGRPMRMPSALQTFDRYVWSRPEWATEAGQINAVEFAHMAGFEHYWFDAAWFPGNFPNGVGNWFPKPKEFPNGLKPVSDACHKYGIQFIIWVEPERVAKGTQIAEEHPEFVFGGKEGGLYKLNDPAAREFLTNLLSKLISDSGIDVYRNDFNMDPLGYWRGNDAPDRQGMTEIRYIEGLYEMWDALRARHPGLWIDNCSSGGRRIDIEMCSRSVPLWRSDTNCSPSHNDWNQAQTIGISQYVTLHTACAWKPDSYEVRSAATAGILCQWGYLDADFPVELGKKTLAEAKANRRYWYGDFYSLNGQSIAPDVWSVFQLHRPDLDAGVIMVFRREESKYTGLAVEPRALKKGRTYECEFIDGDSVSTVKKLTAEELMNLELRLPRKKDSLTLRYRIAR